MCAYAYYELDKPLIEDFEFDALAKEILNNWDNIEHMHKYLLTKDMLVAGTYLGEYPNMVKGAVGNYIRENNL
jgi:NAD-dependent DNA ligase